jgi:hypothetical protein
MDGLTRGECRRWKILAAPLAFLVLAGCASTGNERLQYYRPDLPFSAEEVVAEREAVSSPTPNAQTTACFLAILVDAKGIDYSTPERFLRTLHRHPHGGKHEHSIGHSWLILGGPERTIECGQTGEFGVARPRYYESVFAALQRHDPEPLAYLWTDLDDGIYQAGAGGHKPSVAVLFPISKSEYEAVYSFINHHDYKPFSVREHVCTHFVAEAAARAGIWLGHRMTLNIPKTIVFRGRSFDLWTNPKFSLLTFGSPDTLEKSLKLAVRRGIGKDVLDWYSQ